MMGLTAQKVMFTLQVPGRARWPLEEDPSIGLQGGVLLGWDYHHQMGFSVLTARCSSWEWFQGRFGDLAVGSCFLNPNAQACRR